MSTHAGGRRAATGDQCSWKLDSSTASTSYGAVGRVTASTTGQADVAGGDRAPAGRRRIASSIVTVVVLPLVPVTASQGAARRRAAPQPPGQLDLADHLDAGGRGGRQQRVRRAASPGEVTTRSVPVGQRVARVAERTVAPPRGQVSVGRRPRRRR